MIRTALLWFALTVAAGALILTVKVTGWWPELWQMRIPHIEAGLMGWFLLLVMGTAWWILPRKVWKEHQRGHPAWAWSAYVLLNGGMISIMLNFTGSLIASIGVATYFGAIICFIVGIWPRVISVKDELRKRASTG